GNDLTLEEVNRIGEMVTDSLDPEANVIWGARVTDDMTGKLIVMTIITGVSSPWMLGQEQERTPRSLKQTEESSEEEDIFGIEILQ
ncbi:MAG: cell division protein FtsZ, partial [Candidatus Woesearchaeota archaeon]|nr:cell division protein FtsZ [Candidatus Woesearchaeota archaeon]